MKKIEAFAFSGCKNLVSAILSESITLIGESAFEDCESLASISIPNTVRKFGNCVFPGCKKLAIHAPAGCCAERYAKENKIKYEEI